MAGNPTKPGPGRPKGSPNKVTATAKEAIQIAFQGIGGTDRLIAWVKEDPKNEAVFFSTIFPKLLPHQVEGSLKLEPLIIGE